MSLFGESNVFLFKNAQYYLIITFIIILYHSYDNYSSWKSILSKVYDFNIFLNTLFTKKNLFVNIVKETFLSSSMAEQPAVNR